VRSKAYVTEDETQRLFGELDAEVTPHHPLCPCGVTAVEDETQRLFGELDAEVTPHHPLCPCGVTAVGDGVGRGGEAAAGGVGGVV
jgi:hypothetical protein